MTFLLFAPITLVLGIVTLVLAFLSLAKRKVSKRSALGVGAIFVVALVLTWDEAHKPFLDDGPFHGRACHSIPGTPPDQSVHVARYGFEIQTWDRTPGRPAPIVLLKDRSGKVRWCIFAEAYPQTEVSRVRFGSSGGLFTGATVDGSVEWTYGRERALWFISHTGNLKEYWYSW